jgi:uncharacterized protein YcbK (DUF882 family)
MLVRLLVVFFILSLVVSCNKGSSDDKGNYSSFKGSYNSFNDLHDLHMEAAQTKGIQPMQARVDTMRYLDRLVRLPMEQDMYRIDKLKHSVPFLVEDASDLLEKIGSNFKDSLKSKKMPAYKLIVTSITRTQEDVESLTKRNANASANSVHCYGTTFDISWKRFAKISSGEGDEVPVDKLKRVLAETLHDLRERGKCYIVHEKKQACFHITVR